MGVQIYGRDGKPLPDRQPPTGAQLATAMRDAQRPPPTGYRDEHEVYHPGPGGRGYRQHVVDCAACTGSVGRAIDRGDRWARELFPAWATIVAMPVPGSGMPREALSLWAGDDGTALVRARGRWTALGVAAGGVLGLLLPAAIVVPLLVAGVVLALRWSRQGEDEPTARTVRREARG